MLFLRKNASNINAFKSHYTTKHCFNFLTNKNFILRSPIPQPVRSEHACRCYSSDSPEKSLSKSTQDAQLSEHVHRTSYEKIKHGSKTLYYSGIVLTGMGGLAVLLYTLFKELFSHNSPNSVHTRLLEQCSTNPKVMNVLGDQIKGFQDGGRRGQRNRLQHTVFVQDGVKHMVISFYIEGVRRRGTVKADLIEDENGYFTTRLLYIEVEGVAQPLVLENNTGKGRQPSTPSVETMSEELTF